MRQGGVLPGATPSLQGVDATREAVTGADGGFRFLDLAPGLYKLTRGAGRPSTHINRHV
jgi:hypothetical protein